MRGSFWVAPGSGEALSRERLGGRLSFIMRASSFPMRGYTLIELLVSTVLALVVMLGVVQVFGLIAQGVTDSRATLEMTEQMRKTASILKDDLAGVTVVMSPPRSPDDNEGYFEYTEGAIGPVIPIPPTGAQIVAYNTDTNLPDTTVGDIDDMLMFTTRSRSEPFVGRCSILLNGVVESSDAEVAWFVRGRTLYRRVLLIAPTAVNGQAAAGFYSGNDISVRLSGGSLVGNTLGDLTKPENRFAHQPGNAAPGFPFHPHFRVGAAVPWGTWSDASGTHVSLNLPTLSECSASIANIPPCPNDWVAGGDLKLLASVGVSANGTFDAWQKPHPWTGVDPVARKGVDQLTGNMAAYNTLRSDPISGQLVPDHAGPRVAEDVVLNNVIGFDVKAWDPGAPVLQSAAGQILLPGDPGYLAALNAVAGGTATVVSYGAYVDLNYGCLASGAGVPAALSNSVFAGPGVTKAFAKLGTDPTNPTTLRPAVYDTWSTHYENDSNYGAGVSTNGFADSVSGVVDDPSERQYPPPYAAPLRGIQIKIRCFEPTSRQVREVTVVQEFVTKG
jgi:hypothetical protein